MKTIAFILTFFTAITTQAKLKTDEKLSGVQMVKREVTVNRMLEICSYSDTYSDGCYSSIFMDARQDGLDKEILLNRPANMDFEYQTDCGKFYVNWTNTFAIHTRDVWTNWTIDQMKACIADLKANGDQNKLNQPFELILLSPSKKLSK